MSDLLFTEIGENPQLMLWVKCHRYPYWPAKMISGNQCTIEVNFFGDHSVATVEPKHCYIYSRKNPFAVNKNRHALIKAIKEAALYIRNVIVKFGAFNYAERRTPFKPENISQHLRDMIRPLSNEYVKCDQKQETDERRSLKRKNSSNPSKSSKRESKNSNHQLDQNKRLKFHHQADQDETNEETTSSNVKNDKAILVAITTPHKLEEINSSEENSIIKSTQVADKLNTFETMPDQSNIKSSDNSIPSTSNSNNSNGIDSSCHTSSWDAFRFVTTVFEIASIVDELETLKANYRLFCNDMKSKMERELLHLITEAKTIIETECNRLLNEIRLIKRCSTREEARRNC